MPLAEHVQMLVSCNACSAIINTTLSIASRTNPEYRICYNCYDRHIRECASCGILCPRDFANEITREMGVNNYNQYTITDDTNEPVCFDCVHRCDNCSSVYEYEDSWSECCTEEDSYRNSGWIHDYSYRPAYVFHSESYPGSNAFVSNSRPKMHKLYMGFEIELAHARDLAKEFHTKARESYTEPNFIYLKSDASIGPAGAEFVTMPATLAAFEWRFPWEAFEWLHANGARGWAYDSCGMHIHVSRTAFTPSHLYKFMKFQSSNDTLCAEFAGRNSAFGSWDNESMEKIRLKTKDYLNGATYAERYSAINVMPRNTIELRYFRSNITKQGILRNAQWVDAIYEYTKQMNITVPRINRWNYEPFFEFLEQKPKYSLAFEHVRRVWS